MSDFSYGSDYLEKIFEDQVPPVGPSDNMLGEIVRAWMRLCYRWMNDGDQIGVEYGKETCNPAARFLADNIDELDYLQEWTDRPDNGYPISDSDYDSRLEKITEKVEEFVKDNYQDLLDKPSVDYQEAYFRKEYDEEVYDDEEDEEEWEDDYEDEEEWDE